LEIFGKLELGKAPDGEDKSFFKRELKNLNGEVVK
jgi:hypothetical protein